MTSSQFECLKYIKAPHISEKSNLISESNNQFTFKVRTDATKKLVKNAVERAFGVEVQSVNIVTIKPKTKRFGNRIGKLKKYKKAYVTLKDSDINYSEIKL